MGIRGKEERVIFVVVNISKTVEKLVLGEAGLALHVYWAIIPPWIMPIPEIDFSILENIKHLESSVYPGLVNETKAVKSLGDISSDLHRWISRSTNWEVGLCFLNSST